MALAVAQVGGNVNISGAGDPITSGSWTSVSGSLIVIIGFFFNTDTAATNAWATDSKGNSYTLQQSILGGASAPGIGIWTNNAGTRGTTHTVTVEGQTTPFSEIGFIEITGHDPTTPYDTTTDATAADGTSPFNVTAAAAISGNQIAIYGCVISTSSNTPWTNPSGYTDIIEQPDGAHLVAGAWYKINETGTPTVGASGSWTVDASGARQIFVTIKEASAGNIKTGAGVIGP